MKRLVLLLGLVMMVNCFSLLPVCAKKDSILEGISKLLPFMIGNHQIGQLFSDGLEKQYGLANNPEGLMRVQEVGQKLLSKIDTEQKYDFAILNSNIFNACSIYGGHIRIFSGLIRDTQNSDNELAAILAHEIAHNELGHNRKSVKTFKIAYALELASISQKMPTLLKAGASAVLAKRSRKFERESDLQALEWMDKAGFSPKGAIAVFRRIEAEHRLEQKRSGGSALSQRFNQIFSTHPEPASRVDMAEDFLFTKKYGRTFKDILGASDNPLTGDLPIIVAHSSQWNTPLTTPEKITGIAFFNTNIPPISWKKDFDLYLDILRQEQMICVTADNDFHASPTTNLNLNFTYVDTSNLSREGLIEAIEEGRTYASSQDINIDKANFRIGRDYPKLQKVSWQFTLDLPLKKTLAPKVIVFRNGQEVAKLKKTNPKLERKPIYKFDDNVAPGFYWYVLYIPSQLVTSPITCEVTDNQEDPIDFSESPSWQKGIIHCHSLYSDGKSTLDDIWEAKNKAVDFIFMTEHAHHFGEDKNDYQEFVQECHGISPLLIPGIEYSLTATNRLRHILILGLEEYLEYQPIDEKEFFNDNNDIPEKLLIFEGPVHLGDDEKGSEIEEDAVFEYGPTNATLKLKVKGSPNKDPILWINRREIGRIVTTDDKWHWYEFPISKEWLNNGTNLFHIESFIPDRRQTFDDCEIRDVWILKR